ncbi:MAG: hypothetical protein V4597_11600 [Pseudomonadota bacterium]
MALTRAQNLDVAIDNVVARILEVTSSPKPNYTLDGEQYEWSDYLDMLNRQLLVLEQARQRADGPFEVRSRGI